jgi:hypothetical protein
MVQFNISSVEYFDCIRPTRISSNSQFISKTYIQQLTAIKKIFSFHYLCLHQTKQTPWPLVRKRTISTERQPHVSQI